MKNNDHQSEPQTPISPERYDNILGHLLHRLDQASEATWESLQNAIQEAVELEMAAEEMTRDEIDLLSAYLERDVKQLGYIVHETGEGISAWLNFDLHILEQSILDNLWLLADKTRVQYELLREQLDHDEAVYLSGEMALPGRLLCINCNHPQDLFRSSKISTCSACNSRMFSRAFQPLKKTDYAAE